ncbi:serine--tRNA ligase [candidate division TA06 bacterium]|uniref:Serine--tRNA ligase n=1 Tax=candidate division TA06 bacterium TaxID=2250710 RepID=A0A660SCC0_UNCT6|nr:MAG: serine--tRNA ligase [candidate division TA06 bacterium]
MLDIKFIKENADLVRNAVKNKGEKANVDELITKDNRRVKIVKELDNLRAEKNRLSKEVRGLERNTPQFEKNVMESREIGNRIKKMEKELRELKEEIRILSLWIPNIPHPSVPVGDEHANKIIREWGEKIEFSFKAKSHIDLINDLGLIDFERGAKISGTHFPCYVGIGAKLERALVNFMLDYHIEKHGYKEMFPPFLNNRETLTGTGQLPKLEDDMYYVEKDDMFLNPTAEPPVTNFHRNEILQENDLPIKYTAYTSCFRREAGSYGKETRGLKRVHQFNKVEMVKFVKPENSYDELESLLNNAEEILQILKIPYRVILLSTGDMTFASAKTYDIEAYAPGSNEYLEVSSVSNFEDFQARRMNIKYKSKSDGKLHFVHTLNGSGLATPRTYIAILENYQREDGKIVVPDALKPYMGGVELIG